MLPGLQAICKGHFRGFPDYQMRIIQECFNRSPYPSVILGGREIGKTFPIAIGFLLRAVTQPNFELFCVPGEKIGQAKVALTYMNIVVSKSPVLRAMSGLKRSNLLSWSTEVKAFTNGSVIKALAPNEGVLSEHGSVWCDEYQSLPEPVDIALDGFDNRPGDRRWLSGTAQVRGSPLHRAYLVAKARRPDHIIENPVIEAITAGILDRESIEAKKMVNGGNLNEAQFDAWFNCKFPDVGTLGWHPIESSLTRADLVDDEWRRKLVNMCTGCDPGIPVNRFEVCVILNDGQIHFMDEFELDDMSLLQMPTRGLGQQYVEHGKAFGGGFNYNFHSMLDLQRIAHIDSLVDGDMGGGLTWRDDLFSRAFHVQSQQKLFVNPVKCPNLWRACEEQTFDHKNEMDRLPLTHWIFAMLHGIRGVNTTGFIPSGVAPSTWV